MGLFDRLTGKARREEEAQLALEEAAKKAERKAKAEERKAKKAEAEVNSPKDIATAAGEPWVQVLGIEVDPGNLGAGAFELDWNDIFVARLIKSGYQGKTDQDIVDNWFQDICRNVVMETYQQEQADPSNRRDRRKDLGNGRTEVS
jgi:hypothetical protein